MGQSDSKPLKPQVTAHDKAVLQLKLQRDKLSQSKKRIALVVDKETEIAKACLRQQPPNKTRAKLALRKKKRQQSLLEQLESQSDTLEKLIDTIEFKLIEKDVLFGLQRGNEVLKEINKELSIEKVDKIMDETIEGVKYQEEISERLGELLSNGEELEVDEELEALQREMGQVQHEETNGTEEPIHDNVTPVENISNKFDNIPQIPDNKEQNQEEEERKEESKSANKHVQKEARPNAMLA